MKYEVYELRRAQEDVRSILAWIYKRSPSGAAAWLTAYDSMVEQLSERAHAFPKAEESEDLKIELRQVFFKTQQGRVYRAIFYIDQRKVFILRIRGPGQPPVQVNELRKT